MTKINELESDRLILRQWKSSDFPAFAEITSDAEVMEHFTNTMTQAESNDMATKIQALITKRGWGFWAIEEKESQKFIGYTGLHKPAPELPCSPCVEIGWRLARESWGKGYATEAAQAALRFAFETLNLSEVYAFTAVSNHRSEAVMKRLQMVNTQQNFEHPEVPLGHHLREHVLYKISKQKWLGLPS